MDPIIIVGASIEICLHHQLIEDVRGMNRGLKMVMVRLTDVELHHEIIEIK